MTHHRLIALTIMMVPALAGAHGLDEGNLLLRLAGDTMYVTATPNMAVFSDFDTDGDGHIDRKELRAQREQMAAAFEAGLVSVDVAGGERKRIFFDITMPHTHGRKATYLRVRLRYRFAAPPDAVVLSYGFGDRSPLSVRARRMTPGRLVEQRPMGPAVRTELTAARPKARLFDIKTAGGTK